MTNLNKYKETIESTKQSMLEEIKSILTNKFDGNIETKLVILDAFPPYVHVWNDSSDNELETDIKRLWVHKDVVNFLCDDGTIGALSEKNVYDVLNVLEWALKVAEAKESMKFEIADCYWLDDVTFVVLFNSIEDNDGNSKELVGEYHHDEGQVVITMSYYDNLGDYVGCCNNIHDELTDNEVEKVREIVIKELAKEFDEKN